MYKVFVFILGGAVILCFWALLGAIAGGYMSDTKASIITCIGGGTSAGVWYNLLRCVKFPS